MWRSQVDVERGRQTNKASGATIPPNVPSPARTRRDAVGLAFFRQNSKDYCCRCGSPVCLTGQILDQRAHFCGDVTMRAGLSEDSPVTIVADSTGWKPVTQGLWDTLLECILKVSKWRLRAG